MNGVTNKTQLAEERYTEKLKNDKTEIRIKTKKNIKGKVIKLENLTKITKSIITNHYKKQRKQQKYKTKHCESNRRKLLIRKQNESNKERKTK